MSKETIKEEIFYYHQKELKLEMKKFEKLDNVSNGDFYKSSALHEAVLTRKL